MNTLSLSGLKELAESLADNSRPPCIIALYGNLGTGKTTFSSFFIKKLGVKKNVSSPTFNIFFSYQTKNNCSIYHFDLYRLKTKDDLLTLDIEEYFQKKNAYILIEWPKLIETILKKHKHKKIFFEHHSLQQRNVKVSE